ncbi:MAG TPA: MoaD/ThiS family protein [bacterium]|nr:MoaD/ThiS family protein [bacterium]
MTIIIRIPGPLRETCGGASEVPVPAATIAAALNEIERQHPLLYRGVCDETGRVRRHINLFINKSLVRGPQGLTTQLSPGDVITIMPAVSGG